MSHMHQKSTHMYVVLAVILRCIVVNPVATGVACFFQSPPSWLATLGMEMAAGDIQQTPSFRRNLGPF